MQEVKRYKESTAVDERIIKWVNALGETITPPPNEVRYPNRVGGIYYCRRCGQSMGKKTAADQFDRGHPHRRFDDAYLLCHKCYWDEIYSRPPPRSSLLNDEPIYPVIVHPSTTVHDRTRIVSDD